MLQESEILTEVVRHLDSYTVLTLLQAIPSLQKQAVLITDHSMSPMFFGGVHGVERRIFRTIQHTEEGVTEPYHIGDSAQRVKQTDIPSYDKTIDKQPIKLVEIAQFKSLSDISRKEPGLDVPSSLQDVDFDHTSFLFISFPFSDCNIGYWRQHTDLLIHRLDQFTSCKWHIGTRTFFCDEAERQDTNHPLVYLAPGYRGPELYSGLGPGCQIENPHQFTFRSWGNALEGLETLRIERVLQFPSGLTLPRAAELSIVFDSPQSNQARPIIDRLYAPKLRTFVVHFSSDIPQFKECTIGTAQDSTENEPALKLFELANFKMLDHSSSLPTFVEEKEGKKDTQFIVDLSFLSNFMVVVIGAGVPISAVDLKHLQSVGVIFWHINSKEDAVYHGEAPISIPSLDVLFIHITGPGVKLPAWGWSHRGKLSISSLCLDVSISDLWREVSHTGIWMCNIYSSPKLLSNPNNLDHILHLSREDWISSEEKMKFCGALVLIGFEMNFLKSVVEGEPDVSRDNEYRNITLTPAIDIRKLGSPSFDLTVDIFTVKTWNRDITINPLFVGDTSGIYSRTDMKPEVSLILNIPVILNDSVIDYPCKLAISSLFKQCVLNGEILSMVPNVFWEEQIMRLSSHRYHKRNRILSHRWDIPKHSYNEIPIAECKTLRERMCSVFSNPYADFEKIPKGKEIERGALKRWDPIFYNPFVKFPNDPRTYTVESGHCTI